MKFSAGISFGLSVLMLGLSQASVNGFTLDAFTETDNGNNGGNEGQVARLNTSIFGQLEIPSSTDTGLTGGTVFGESRTIRLTLSSGFLPIFFYVDNFIANDAADLSAPFGNNNIVTTEIIWDGNDSSNTPTDFEQGGASGIQLDIESLTLGTGDGDIELNFELKDTNNNVATITETITSNITSAQALDFEYQDRVEDPNDLGGGDIDLGLIDYVRFYTSDENQGSIFTFNSVQTVPFDFSPSLGIIIGTSFMGFELLRRRQKKIKG